MRLFNTLYAKLSAVLIVLLSTMGLLFATFDLHATRHFLQELNQRFNAELAQQLLTEQGMSEMEWLKEEHIKELFRFYMHINPAIEIYLLDDSGKILAFEAPEMRIKRERVRLEPIKQFLNHSPAYPILGDDPRSNDRRKVFSAAAIPSADNPRQYLYVVLTGEDYEHISSLLHSSYYLKQNLIGVAIAIIAGLLIGLLAFNLLTKRLRLLNRTMQRFRHSDFQELAAPRRSRRAPDEIDTLAETFEEMANTIRTQMGQLEQKDNLRRNLVANVSHDLRTPLAALNGYLETLLVKGKELPPEEANRYLDIAYRQGQRLSQLVAELFELSRLDAHETLPEKEPVAIGDLLFDVLQKFQPEASQKRTHLSDEIETNLPLVSADVPMLDRVFENLISNAINNTPMDGHIRVTARRSDGGVQVQIENSGELDQETIDHLFDRFYQSPANRHGKGAGLGLAIVKQILELHDAPIRVESTTGVVRFEFVLPLWK